MSLQPSTTENHAVSRSSAGSPAAPRVKNARSAVHFWRACGFLFPHRRLVIISILCAFGVGLTFASGLGALLPILRLMINGDTLQAYAARVAVENRLGVKLDESTGVVIVKMKANSPAALAGLKDHGVVRIVGDIAQAKEDEPSVSLLALGDPGRSEVLLASEVGSPRSLSLAPLPWYMAALVRIANRLPARPVPALAVVLLLVFVLSVVGNLVRYFQEFYSDRAGILAVNDIRRKLYNHVLHLPLGFFGLKGTSDVTSRIVQDAQALQDGFKTVLGQSIQEPIKAAMAFGLALWFDWHLTLFIILFGPLMFMIIKKFGKKMRRASRKALQSSASMLGQLEGSLIGIRVVKAAVAERFERRRYMRVMGGLIAEQVRMSRIDAVSTPVLEVLTLIVVSLIVLYAAYLVRVRHTLDATTFMGLMACLMGIGESLRKFSKVNNALQKSNAAAGRIFETLDIPIEERRRALAGSPTAAQPQRYNLPTIQRELRFQDVSFTYSGSSTPAVSAANLVVPRGQCVAVVGRNGSGKTTLLALLPRFFDPQSGRILIDGQDIRLATLRSLRRQIGIVTQEAVIFPGTIAQNIAYGLPLVDRQLVIDAAKRAFAHDFIMEKAGGYDAILGEHGAQLSGGQRQRLCIARAIFRQTPILILDEATSQVDAESEHLIQQAIENLMHQRTTFVIAHRFSTILSADTIVVMERGQIIAQGKHDQLVAGCPLYQQLYERQLFAVGAGDAKSG